MTHADAIPNGTRSSADARPTVPARIRSALGGVRARLVLLALACMAPMLLLAAGATIRYVTSEQKSIRDRGIELARLAAEDVDQEIAAARALLIGLSTSQAMQGGDMEALYRQAAAASQRYGRAIGFTDGNGNRHFNTMRPYGASLPRHPAADLIRMALDTRQTQISNLVPAPTRGDRVVLLLEPALAYGVPIGVLGIELDVAGMVQRIAENKLPEHWLVAIVDRNGVIIGRSRLADRYVGTPATPELQAMLAGAPSGAARSLTKEGTWAFTAYTQVRSSGWSVVVGVPDSVVRMPLDSSIKGLAVTAAGVTALTISLALFVARGISHPMQALAQAARDLGQGKPVPPVVRGLREVERVWRALHRAGADLTARARERDAAEAEQAANQRRIQELQLDLMRASRISAMGAVGSTIAHELNQPLAAIVNHLEGGRLVAAAGGCPAEVTDALAQALAQAERAGAIIRNIRAFATGQPVQCRPEAVGLIVEQACVLGLVGSGGSSDIQVVRDVPADCPPILADHVQMQQVLVNLIRNAVEAMADSPRRELTVRAVHDGAAGMVEFSVADTGTGVSDEVAGTLFSPFLTTKPDGMGVGLAIARAIVEAHGGRIWAEPCPGGGALFRFTIPTAAEADARDA